MKILLKASLLLVTVFSLNGCKLDLNSSQSIQKPAGDAGFESYTDAQNFATGADVYFRAVCNGVYNYYPEIQGDMFSATVDFGNNGGDIHTWEYTSGAYGIRDMWRGYYSSINESNIYIRDVEGLLKRDGAKLADDQKANIALWKGKCHFYRAYAYYQLAQGWCKDYEPSTATTDLGLPLVLEYNVEARPARATLALTYEQIEKDIAQARTLLAGVTGAVLATTPSIDAVNALDARVQLNKHNYTGAAKLAGDLITSGKYALVSTYAGMDKEWTTDNGTEDILQMFASINENTNANSYYLGAAYAAITSNPTSPRHYAYASPYFLPSATLFNIYERELVYEDGELSDIISSDIRFQFYITQMPVNFSVGLDYYFIFGKYLGNPTFRTTLYYNGYQSKPKVLTIPEMYLIQAEALASQGQDASAPLNALQTARGATPTDGSMASVQKEWARETVGQGMRIQCLKRWKQGFENRPVLSTIDPTLNPRAAQEGVNFAKIKITADNYKFVWPIPNIDMQTNPNLVQNPGWAIEAVE